MPGLRKVFMTTGYVMNVSCPYCGGWAELVDSAEVYGGRSYGNVWLCRRCDAYVGCHAGTDEPLGTLADAETRHWRKRAHASFDPLWRGDGMTRAEAYRWLAGRLGVHPNDCHVGLFDVETCKRVVELCRWGETL